LCCQTFRVTGFEQQSGFAIAHQFRITAHPRGYRCGAARHGFHQRIGERFGEGWQDEHIDTIQPQRYIMCIRLKDNAITNSELTGETFQSLPHGAAAHNQQF